ncbi:MAG: hypothetical protein ABH951_02870 [Patescibacteria group bacterium]
MKKTNNYLLLFILACLALEAIFFFIANFKSNEIYRIEEEKKLKTELLFSNLELEAKAFSVYDATEQKEIYGKNQYKRLPIASLTKTMTVLVALDNYNLEDQIKISDSDLKKEGDNGLFLNEKWKVSDLAKFSLILSSNDGAFALTHNDKFFIEKMNIKAKEIGMINTLFLNSTGLDINSETSGASASALDVNIMNINAFQIYPEVFSSTALPELIIKSDSKISHDVKNTNLIIDKIPNLLFSKTGLTQLAGGNLSIIFINKENHEIAMTVLGSTIDGRFSDMEKLLSVLLF